MNRANVLNLGTVLNLGQIRRSLRVLWHRIRHGHQKIILVASDCLPLADQESGGLRLSLILESFQKLGLGVIFVSHRGLANLPGGLVDKKIRKKYERFIKVRGVREIVYGLDDLREFLAKKDGLITLAFVAFPHVAADIIPMIRAYAKDASILYDMVDAHALRMKREAALLNSESKFAEAAKMERLEARIYAASDVVFAVSQAEQQYVIAMQENRKVYVLGNAFRLRNANPPGPSGRKNILFLGGFWHSPNLDAVTWFIAEVWPLVRLSNPETRFLIGGSNMEDRLNHFKSTPGVEILGYVADLGGFFDRGRVMVAPLRFGAGVKGKVGQSMAFGLPVVATSIAAEGMRVTHGKEIIVADSAEEMALSIAELLENDERWCQIQGSALSYIASEQSPEAIEATLAEALFEVEQNKEV